SEKLSELFLKHSETEDAVVRKERILEELKTAARKLQMAAREAEAAEAATEVRRLAKDDAQARTTLALLGVVPPLVGLLDAAAEAEGTAAAYCSQIASLYALLNLSIANNANKAAIVKAGAIAKMMKLINAAPNQQTVSEAVAANFLSLSALDSNKPIIGASSGAIPFLVDTLKRRHSSTPQSKCDSLRALSNLSISPRNLLPILETDLVPHLFNRLGADATSANERILSILCNLASVSEGRREIGSVPDAFPILVDVLNWRDSPECQEKASYVLMVMARRSYEDKRAMIEAGIVSALLELTLVGSNLAQRMASRMLESFTTDKAASSPASSLSLINLSDQMEVFDEEDEEEEEEGDSSSAAAGDGGMMSKEKKAVKQLVQLSLQSNMKKMVLRANLPREF
ncbi:hypothetical protein M569_10585, partial [Genlisea aurea]